MARSKKAPRASVPRKSAEGLPDDMYDEVETLHRQKMRMEMDEGADMELDDEDDQAAVLGVDADEGSDFDSDDDLEAGGKLAKIVAAERAIKRKLALARGEKDDDELSDEEVDEAAGPKWGKKRSAYYDNEGVDVDFDSDDEAAEEEAEEAVRMQKEAALGMDAADLEMFDDDEDDNEDDGHTLGGVSRGTEDVREERVDKAIGDMTDTEKLDAVMNDAPELLTLLDELHQNMGDVRTRISPLLVEVKAGGLATPSGISYLEAKHILLLSYCINIMFYMLLKLEGRSVREHPVIARLVQIRAFLDKLRPIDKKLQYQVEKLVKAAGVAARGQALANGGGADPLTFRANPGSLVSKADDAPEDGDGVYRPPKLMAVSMDDPGKDARLQKEQRKQRNALKRAQNSEYMRGLEAELTGAPTEMRETGGFADSISALKSKQRMEARARQEEDLMIRVPLTKEERKQLKKEQRAGEAGLGVLDDFQDDVAALISEDGMGAGASTRLNQKFGVDLSSQKALPASGDAELPRKADLQDRRARYDSLKAKQQAQLEAMEEDVHVHKRPRVEDEFYMQTKAAAEAKQQAKRDRRKAPVAQPPLADETTTEARAITSEIQKNKGLTPHRRKDLKNPRKKGRVKFAEASKRRKGQVQDVKTAPGAYGGEASGIKTHVSKSTRL